MTIYLCEILPVFAQVSAQKKYKLHFAQKGKDPVSGQDTEQPLDVFVRSRDDWQGWHEHRPIRNDFNRSFIFALAHFHPYKNLGKKVWLFGGIYGVIERPSDRYVVELTDQAEAFIGRLILQLPEDHNLPIRPNLETYYRDFEVLEILREPYSG